jgi:hypothetical protein
VALPPGTYQVVIHAATEVVIENVVVRPNEVTEVTIPADDP